MTSKLPKYHRKQIVSYHINKYTINVLEWQKQNVAFGNLQKNFRENNIFGKKYDPQLF